VRLPHFAFNIAFGGSDYKSLFLTLFAQKPMVGLIGAVYQLDLLFEGCPQ
jgi:hypothetical protein